jgi:uncharacterized protein DUF3606
LNNAVMKARRDPRHAQAIWRYPHAAAGAREHAVEVRPTVHALNMHEPYEVKYWTHKLNVSKEELQKAVDKKNLQPLCVSSWGFSTALAHDRSEVSRLLWFGVGLREPPASSLG